MTIGELTKYATSPILGYDEYIYPNDPSKVDYEVALRPSIARRLLRGLPSSLAFGGLTGGAIYGLGGANESAKTPAIRGGLTVAGITALLSLLDDREHKEKLTHPADIAAAKAYLTNFYGDDRPNPAKKKNKK